MTIILTLGLVILAQSSQAIMIEGDLTISGDFTTTGGTGSLDTATGIDFLGDNFQVDGATGSFASVGITAGDTGTITDFTFSPDTTPIDPFFSIGGFTFTLQDTTVVAQNSFFLILSGYGVFTGNGYEETEGYWNLTANQNGSLFNFSSGTTTVPEPGSLILLGIGLLGLMLHQKRLKHC